MKITGEKPFQVLAHSFAVSPSNEGYTLNYSADGISYTAYGISTPAGENLLVTDAPKGCYWKLAGNQSEVIIQF